LDRIVRHLEGILRILAMIVWLASYPRSGNTFLRILLNRAFAIKTLSLYDDRSDIGARPALSNVVGHRAHGMHSKQFRQYASRSDKVFMVKTHEQPNDEAKAIYVVRDGRAAVISFFHYCHYFFPNRPLLSDVITGKQWPGAWSSHVDAWVLSRRPNTLVIRFEDLIAENTLPLRRIANFLDLPEPQSVLVDFAELHKEFPIFFRCGSNETNIAELKGDNLNLFWALHGKTMEQMGYSNHIADRASAQ
jgi:Sulfotransferase domain